MVTKLTGVISALLCVAIFTFGFGQIQFGYYAPPPGIPTIDVLMIKWVCAALAMTSLWSLVVIMRVPATSRR